MGSEKARVLDEDDCGGSADFDQVSLAGWGGAGLEGDLVQNSESAEHGGARRGGAGIGGWLVHTVNVRRRYGFSTVLFIF